MNTCFSNGFKWQKNSNKGPATIFMIFNLFLSSFFHSIRLFLFHHLKQLQFRIYLIWLLINWVLNLWPRNVSCNYSRLLIIILVMPLAFKVQIAGKPYVFTCNFLGKFLFDVIPWCLEYLLNHQHVAFSKSVFVNFISAILMTAFFHLIFWDGDWEPSNFLIFWKQPSNWSCVLALNFSIRCY